MFNNNNNQSSENGASLIGEGLNVEGDLNCKGSIEVAGIMNGNIIAIYTKKLNETPKHNNLPKVDLESLEITSIL